MKTFIPIFFFLCSLSTTSLAQGYDSIPIPPYQEESTLPDFNLLLTDSTWVINMNIPTGKPVVIIYFSPDCGHCQLTAKEFEEKMDDFKDVFFVWVSYQPVDKIKTFAADYKMLKKENIRIGRDPNYFIPAFFKVKFTPFMAVYNKAGKLMQTFEGTAEPASVSSLLNAPKP